MTCERFRWPTAGKARTENMVVRGNARITLLTDRLLRLEYDPAGRFVDEASQFAFYRDLPPVGCTVREEGELLTVETEYLQLQYHIGMPFSAESLSVQLRQSPATLWHFGEAVPQLKGTACTLDNIDGAVALEDGVCSRSGYTVVDDSKSLLLTDDGWFGLRSEGQTDLYFFGYGHDYRSCVADYYRLTGAPPLLPDYALGNWWSRYHKYTQEEYCALVERFERERIPFSVSVVDMDWHTTTIPPESCIDHPRFRPGWTGYSWNRELFPDYRAFLHFLHEHNLKTALNLHPAGGVGCHEDMYEAMAQVCGIDPVTKQPVRQDLLNPDYMQHYFDILHHPYEVDGVDFWWIDWQQGDDYWWIRDEEHPPHPLEQMKPLWLLNHLHILDISRNGKRPMFFSRYCGLGAHRYPVGFSGDSIITWESLAFQPYFTATASNAGYGWWSHDIGGHMNGYRDDVLQVRWLQLGVLSPINRLHSTSNPFNGKEPWNLSEPAASVAADWLRLRHRLFPYLYTMNHRAHADLQPLVQPMYYSHPERDEAYSYRNQFWFGSELMVAPITEKNDPCSMLGAASVWLPEGLWFDCFNGLVYRGDRELRVHRSLREYPVFARAGAILPTEPYEGDNRLGGKEQLTVLVFPGADNCFTLYEDAGDGSDYRTGGTVRTKLQLQWGDTAVFTIHPAEGDRSLIPPIRRWQILLRGFAAGLTVTATTDGAALPVRCSYDAATNTTAVSIDPMEVQRQIVLQITAQGSPVADNSTALPRIFDLLLHAQMSYAAKTALWEAVQRRDPYLHRSCTEQEYRGVLAAVWELYDLLP